MALSLIAVWCSLLKAFEEVCHLSSLKLCDALLDLHEGGDVDHLGHLQVVQG